MTLLRKWPCYIQALCLALMFSAASAAERKKWETLSDCQYVAKEHNDGDSFRVRCGSREFVLRLYYVDAPEVTVRGNADRVREQSDHFGVMSEDIPEAGLKARDAVREILKKPFVVQTRWAVAGGRSAESRYYGMVEMDGKAPYRNPAWRRTGTYERSINKFAYRGEIKPVSTKASCA